MREARIGSHEVMAGGHVRHVTQRLVPPVVKIGNGRARTSLRVELDVGDAEADKAGEEGLVHLGILLEGGVLDHRRQLQFFARWV